MNESKKSRGTIFTGIFAAIAASLCCITPVVAAIGGLGGVASSFSWMEPLRPYLIAFTVLIFGFAWYQKLKPSKKEGDACGCEVPVKKTPFLQTKTFLAIMTVFAVLMLSFPSYSGIFFPDNRQALVLSENSHVISAELSIDGMTCTGCEHHVNHALQGQNGVIEASSSYKDGKAIVKFDESLIDIQQLSTSVENETGYVVTNQKITSK